MSEKKVWGEYTERSGSVKARQQALSKRNRNVPILNAIEVSPEDEGACLVVAVENRPVVFQGAVGACSSRPPLRQRPQAIAHWSATRQMGWAPSVKRRRQGWVRAGVRDSTGRGGAEE